MFKFFKSARVEALESEVADLRYDLMNKQRMMDRLSSRLDSAASEVLSLRKENELISAQASVARAGQSAADKQKYALEQTVSSLEDQVKIMDMAGMQLTAELYEANETITTLLGKNLDLQFERIFEVTPELNDELNDELDHAVSSGEKVAKHAVNLADALTSLLNNSIPFSVGSEKQALDTLKAFDEEYPDAPRKAVLRNQAGIYPKAA